MPGNRPAAVVFGCAGTVLDEAEKRFFAAADPLGFILFTRNVESPDQMRKLVAEMRGCVGRHAPVLIDQEGGRVQRLRPPRWPAHPPMAAFGRLARSDRERAARAAALNARLIAAELIGLGIDVDCVPVLDVPVPDVTLAIGDRALADDPGTVALLGRAIVEAMLGGGVMPVIKHLPGHGRALVDSHGELPRVTASRAELAARDYLPFRALRDAPWGMTAHLLFTAIDPGRPATLSAKVIGETIRGEIGFDGLLLSDDLSMKALAGGYQERASGCLAAGCDVALHCNGKMDEMRAVAAGVRPLTDRALERIARGEAMRRSDPPPAEGRETLAAWLAEAAA